ncbi:MAG: PAS domain-containing protein, partial [Proteobacteria bacterium]|nr:PAS domain-containing protein [Pseudomonadota bacterium]
MHSLTFHLQEPTSVPIELQQLIDAIPIGVSLIDESCTAIAINKALQVLTGFSSVEASGLPCYHV